MDKRFGLKTNCIADIVNVLKLQPEVDEAFIFGSRAMGTYKNGSDIDIALKGEKITFDTISAIRLRLDELPYLYMYDIIDYKKVSNPAVTAHIDELGITFYKKEELPSEWKTYKLADICSKIGSGATPRGGKEAYFETEEYSLIRSQNVLDFSFSKDGLAFISEEQAKELRNVTIEKDDILLNITGDSVARVCQVPDEILPARVNQHVAIIRGNSSIINQKYLKYYLLEPSFKGYMLGMSSSGATRNALTKAMIENFEIKLPDLNNQKQIAQILTSLDDKIELNLQMNQTLEATAQALFKEWFVNFNFPKCLNHDSLDLPDKKDFRKENQTEQNQGNQKNQKNHGSDKLPKGWRMGKLGEVVSFVKGVSYRSSELVPSKFALVTLKSFNRFGGLNYKGFKEFFGKYKETQVLNEGDVVIAQTDITQAAEVIGCPAIVENPFEYEKLIASIDLVKCIPINNHFSEAVLFYFLNEKRFKDYCLSHTNGSTVLHLRSSALPNFEFPIPDNELLKKFTKIINPIREKIISNNKQIQSLTQTRDTLLPKLMSGKIEIKK